MFLKLFIWDNHYGVITHLEPDILDCEVKWTLGSITINKDSGGNGIQAELFHILKGCCESAAFNTPTNLENSAVATGLEKSVFIPNQRRIMPKKVQTTAQLHSFQMPAM